MKKALATLFILSTVAMTGCSYAGVAVTADGKAVIAKNNFFLWGLLNSVHVCQVTPAGLAQCSSAEAP